MERNNTDLDQLVSLPTEEVKYLQETPGSTAFYIISTILAILGIIGNTLTIIVMRTFEKISTSIYLSALAVFDNILLLTGEGLKLVVKFEAKR